MQIQKRTIRRVDINALTLTLAAASGFVGVILLMNRVIGGY